MHSSIGYYIHNNENIALSLKETIGQGLNYVVIPLTHPLYSEFRPISDVFLDFNERSLLIVYVHRRDYTLKKNVNFLRKILNYSSHFGVTNIVLEAPLNDVCLDILAEQIEIFLKKNNVLIHLKISLISQDKNVLLNGHRENTSFVKENDFDSSWICWNRFRMKLNNHANVKLALELNADLPDDERIERLLGEVVSIIFLKTSIFQTNIGRYPTLSKPYQEFIKKLIFKTAGQISFTIEGNNMHECIGSYGQYIKYLQKEDALQQTVSENCKGFEDVLQVPLQPLKDNLHAAFYEIFESDFIKYRQYYFAIHRAFIDLNEKDEIIVMVLGAGRGPLVEKALDAARDSNKKIIIYALDKNENAIVTLESLRELRWGGMSGLEHGRVVIVNEDMRKWHAPQKADIVISELLGSFGDNELSPECLDGVWRYVHEKTISIPYEYTSFIAPVQSQKLYSAMKSEEKLSNPCEFGYVVHVRNAYLIDEPKAVFKFEHDNLLLKPEERNNSRSKTLKFSSKLHTTCHGFVGYFNCHLYKDIIISIEPSTANANMFSWFPIYFPIEKPFTLGMNDDIELNIRRIVDEQKVWYEWKVTCPIESKIHNCDGKVYAIGLYLDESI